MGSFVFLSGPSCVGKGPLLKAVAQFHPEIAARMQKVTLYTSREKRAGEEDGREYHFRSQKEIYALAQSSRYLCFPVHNDAQAIDLEEVRGLTGQDEKIGFLEIFHTAAAKLKNNEVLKGAPITTVFLSPVSRSEVQLMLGTEGGLGNVSSLVQTLMARKQLRSALVQNKGLTQFDMQAIGRRADRAFEELLSAANYDFVLPNHDGEESPYWGLPFLLGDAARTLGSFVDILSGSEPRYAEHWRGLFPKGTMPMGVPVLADK